MLSFGRLLALFAFISFLGGPAWAERRVALVIGNAAYNTMEALRNPASDAQDIAATLLDLGFTVETHVNLRQEGMRRAIEAFARRSADADISVLYYAGHGIEVDGRNLLIPIDALLETTEDVRTQTLDLSKTLLDLSVGDGVRIVFLDACRNNPVPSLKLRDGLAAPQLPRENFLVAFAALPQNVAYDGGGRNSPFAASLLHHLHERGQDLTAVLATARNEVKLNTGAKQLPQEWSTLTRQVYLAPGPRDEFPPDTQLFQLAAKGPDNELLRLYLARYPDGSHVDEARSLTEISPTHPQTNTQNEEDLWALARKERIGPLLELYLARYPDGAHAAQAKEILPTLTTANNISADALCLQLATHPNDSTAIAPGVPGPVLNENRDRAIAVCRQAVTEFPENPHFLTLLARAMAAGLTGSEIPSEAIAYYETAAEQGDARAMVSLGLLKQTGNGVPKDLVGAVELYQRAADRHFPDGGVQLGYAFATGAGINKDMERAVQVYKRASLDGSATATFNLGVLYLETPLGLGTHAEALELFLRSAEHGEWNGYVAAAKLLDGGYDLEPNYETAADYLLKGLAIDAGGAFEELTAKADTWSKETIRAVQKRLLDVGYYQGTIDGQSGPKFAAALNLWRLLGPGSSS